jgi:transcriptional regulator of acetoin/glycerol metabolism
MNSHHNSAVARSAAVLSLSAFAVLIIAALHGQKTFIRKKPSTRASHSAVLEPAANPSADEIISLCALEKSAIVAALEKLNGNKLLAAQRLGIGKTTLYRKLKKYGIVVETVSRPPLPAH